MKEQALKIKNAISRMVQSDWFIVFNAAIILLGWALNIWVPMLCVLVAVNVVPLFFDRHTKHLLSMLMMFSLIMSSHTKELLRFAPLLSLLGVLFVAMIFNLIVFKRSLMPLHPKNVKGFHASMFALILPMALAGAGSPAEVPLFSLALVALTVVFCLIYSFFVVCVRDDEERKELPDYILKTLATMGIIVSLQMIIFYAKIGDINEIVQAMMSKSVHLGWAGPNNIGALLCLSIPSTLYFCIRKNFAAPLLTAIALIEYALIISTGSRGAILVMTMAMPAILLYIIVKSENKLAFGITASVVIAVAVVLVAYYGDVFANVITTILNKRLTSANRNELYRLAADAFKTWPLFGAGWDYKTDTFYFSTLFQIIATMGIFGLIMFAVFYFWRYKTFLKLRTEPAVPALLCGSVLFEACGLWGETYFVPNFFLILLIMTFAAEINVPDNACLAFGGKDPVAHVVGYFRILADRVKPIKSQASGGNDKAIENAEKTPAPAEPAQSDAPDDASPADNAEETDNTETADIDNTGDGGYRDARTGGVN